MKTSAFALLFVLLLAAPASAAPPPTPAAEAEAKRLYEDGTNAFRLLEYNEAIKDYKAAFKLVPKPFFIYNIAQAYRLAGDPRNALAFYKSFLDTLPDAPNRAEVEDVMADLQAEIAKLPAPQPEPAPHAKIPPPDQVTTPTPAPQLPATSDHESRPIYKKWWFWAGIGAVAAGAVVIVAVSGGGGGNAPSTDLGSMKVFP